MAGIYIHIPFCKQACSYCDFHFSTNLTRRKDILAAIQHEITLRKNYLQGEVIETIYLGGGTPSLLSKDEIEALLEKICNTFQVNETAEITLEANPDDLTPQKLKELSSSSVNRLSIGVQSFFDTDLKFMNRAHSATEALNSIQFAQSVGFKNINIDLIFGGQTTSDQMWNENLEQFIELKVPHLSAYSLTIEEKTALYYKVRKGELPPIDDEKNYRQYLLLQQVIDQNNYEQYELSNYCKNELLSKHNASYWQGKKYLGLGPSAHSFNGMSRQWNVNNNISYLKALRSGESYFEKEALTETDLYHEYLITSLRTKWGIKISEIETKFTSPVQTHFNRQLKKINSQKLDVTQERVSIKREFLFQSDEVIRALML